MRRQKKKWGNKYGLLPGRYSTFSGCRRVESWQLKKLATSEQQMTTQSRQLKQDDNGCRRCRPRKEDDDDEDKKWLQIDAFVWLFDRHLVRLVVVDVVVPSAAPNSSRRRCLSTSRAVVVIIRRAAFLAYLWSTFRLRPFLNYRRRRWNGPLFSLYEMFCVCVSQLNTLHNFRGHQKRIDGSPFGEVLLVSSAEF